MEAMDIRKHSYLPPEIFEIIVREIASQDSTGETLKACSLVSKSFCFSCRRHLFSDIKLVSNIFYQSRAASLVKILQNPDNVALVACVRSLSLTFNDVPGFNSRAFLGSSTLGRRLYELKMMALNFAGRFRLCEKDLLKAFNLLMQAPLESFTLDARRGASDWETESETAKRKNRALLVACIAPLATSSTLRTLRLSDLFNIDESLIAHIIRCSALKELSLRRITLRICDASLDLQPVISQIERLDLRNNLYMQVLRTMGRPTFPTFSMPYPFITFSHLRTLIISGPCPDLETDVLWQFMLGVANTLETLEIEEIEWRGPIQLGQLTSLRNLKITSNAVNALGSFERNLRTVCQLLSPPAAASTPVKIQFFTVHFNVNMALETHFRRAQEMHGWLDLDEILMDNSFPNLQKVDLAVHFFFVSTASTDSLPRINIDIIDTDLILPRLSTHPSIVSQLHLGSIFTPHPMAVYLYLL